MSVDFTIIMDGKSAFGNEPEYFKDEPDSIFAGGSKEFTFSCPNVKSGESAVLMFQSRDVDFRQNVISVNGHNLDRIPVCPHKDAWNGNVMLINPRTLKNDNKLCIESRNKSGGWGGDLDDFMLDSMVVMYKTQSGGGLPQPHLVVEQTEFDFGLVRIGNGLSKTLVIHNKGGATLNYSIVSPPQLSPFRWKGSTATIKPDANTSLEINFLPLEVDSYSAELVINSDDPDWPEVTVTLKGRGMPSPDID